MRIDLWADVACPWCAIGAKRLVRALAAFRDRPGAPEVAVEVRSYQLNPTLPPDFEGVHDEYLASHLGMTPDQVRAAGERVTALAAAEGLAFDLPRVVIANTARAHELLQLARSRGQGAAMAERLMRATFVEGRALGRPEVLGEIAAEARLDPAEVQDALAMGTYRDAVRADVEQAARYGIRGVPFFVIDDRLGVSGAQEAEVLLDVLAKAAAEAA